MYGKLPDYQSRSNMKSSVNIKTEIEKIKSRNKKVESDKVWETSKTRKAAIFILTYIAVYLFFKINRLPNPALNSLIPAVGFLLSTLSLSVFKGLWLKYIYRKQN